jgi:hypothetical protein
MIRFALVMVLVGCMGDPAAMPDASTGGTIEPPPQCPPLPSSDGFDFYGEACTSAPSPALTLCHDAADNAATWGWCVSGTCRPQSGSPCPHCPAGTVHVTMDGAEYCAP